MTGLKNTSFASDVAERSEGRRRGLMGRRLWLRIESEEYEYICVLTSL